MANEITFGNDTMTQEQYNAELRAELRNGKGDGRLAFASTTGTSYIRMQVFEEGFARKILPAEAITPDELSEFFTDVPGKIIEVEPAQGVSATLPFDTANETLYYMAPKSAVFFFDIKTPRYQKNIKMLDTYRTMDLRKVMMDLALKSMSKQEDWEFVQLSEDAVAASGGVLTFVSGISRNTITELGKIMGKRMLPNGLVLCNNATMLDFAKMGRDAWGGDGAEKLLREGPKSLGEPVMMGMKFLSTLKSDIVNDNVLYLYTQPDYLGKFYELEAPTMYVERKEDRITMNANETIGMTIVNTAGVAKAQLFGGALSVNSGYPTTQRPVRKATA